MGNYILLKDLEIYKLTRILSELGWKIYLTLDWDNKKTFGKQFIEATDSVGANIAEGYNRFHYLDKIKFYYNSRASLSEANDHWVELINKRIKINSDVYKEFKESGNLLALKLNNYINAIYKAKSLNLNKSQ